MRQIEQTIIFITLSATIFTISMKEVTKPKYDSLVDLRITNNDNEVADILSASESRYRTQSPYFWFRRPVNDDGESDEYAGGNGEWYYHAGRQRNSGPSTFSYAAIGGGWGR